MSTWPHAWVPTPQIGNSCGQPPNFDDVTFPSPQPACHHGVPSTCVGLVTLGSNFTCRQQSVGPCQTTPPHQPLAPCLLATAWVTAHGVQLSAVPCPMHLAGRHGTGVGSSGGGGIDCRAATRLTHRSTLSRVCAGAIWTKIERRYDRRKLPQLAAATARPSCLARSLARPPAPQSAARPLVAGSPVARSIVDR
jgi:hypothetical protein